MVKAFIKPHSGKLLLNEFLAGSLANLIDLPWPKTSLAILNKNACEQLANNAAPALHPECVAMEFIDELQEVPPAPLPKPKSDWDFSQCQQLPKANQSHLPKFFDSPESQSAFYGYELFQLWLFFAETKIDTLFALPNKTPLFLDGSFAFGGPEWDNQILDYSRDKTFPQSYHSHGILTKPELFQTWFDNIEQLGEKEIEPLLKSVPQSWGVSEDQLAFLHNLLIQGKKKFIAKWKARLLNAFNIQNGKMSK